MLWWLSVAPFGKPVVPLVYWMLIGSSESSAPRSGSGPSPASSASHSGEPSSTTRSSSGRLARTSSIMAA